MTNADQRERAMLARGLGFTPADLCRNQTGRLSIRQRIKLLRTAAAHSGKLCVSIAPAAFMIGLLSCLIFVGWKLSAAAPLPTTTQRVTLKALSRYMLLLGGYLAAMGALVYYGAGWLGRGATAGADVLALLRDIVSGKVERLHGRVRIGRERFCLGDREFCMPPGAAGELTAQDGIAWYTLYFAPHSQYAVSAEPHTPAGQNV